MRRVRLLGRGSRSGQAGGALQEASAPVAPLTTTVARSKGSDTQNPCLVKDGEGSTALSAVRRYEILGQGFSGCRSTLGTSCGHGS